MAGPFLLDSVYTSRKPNYYTSIAFMSAAQYDFEIDQGSSFRIIFKYKDNNGLPIDITNWCARLTWKTNANSAKIFNTNELDDSEYKFTLEGAQGRLILELPASTTNGFDFTSAKYDLELQSDEDHYLSGSGGGKYTTRLLYGSITIKKRYSKSNNALECNE